MKTDQLGVCTLCNSEVWSLLLQILQQTSLFHVRHHNIGGRACIYTDSNQTEDVWMGECLHLQTLIQ